jgi:uncharacterized protein (UPF0179 family)
MIDACGFSSLFDAVIHSRFTVCTVGTLNSQQQVEAESSISNRGGRICKILQDVNNAPKNESLKQIIIKLN